MVVITSYFGEVAAESPAIAGYVVTVVTREGGVKAQDYGHHIDKADLILTVEFRGDGSDFVSHLCTFAATVREKLLSSAPCTRTERRELSPAESPLFLRSPTSLAGLSFLVAFPRRSLRSSRQVYAIYYIPSSVFLLLLLL